jgi:hypothetical protein
VLWNSDSDSDSGPVKTATKNSDNDSDSEGEKTRIVDVKAATVTAMVRRRRLWMLKQLDDFIVACINLPFSELSSHLFKLQLGSVRYYKNIDNSGIWTHAGKAHQLSRLTP